MNKHKNILEPLLKGSPEDTEVKSLLINNMLLLDIMFKKYPELKSVAVDLFCSYEVQRKTDEYEQNIEKLRPADSDLVYRVNLPRKTTIKIEKLREVSIIRDGDFPSIESTVKVLNRIINRLNELVDAVNELKGMK